MAKYFFHWRGDDGNWNAESARQTMIQALTTYDRGQDAKGLSTPYRLGHYFEAIAGLYENPAFAWTLESPRNYIKGLDRVFCQLPPVDSAKRNITKEFGI